MNEGGKADQPDVPVTSDAQEQLRLARRVDARRKFLRYGASGSAAMVATVSHKRAFAKKAGALASQCASLQGIPDLTKANSKKALVTSALGGQTNLVCRPQPPATDPNGKDSCTATISSSTYVDSGNQRVTNFFDGSKMGHGCGELGNGYVAGAGLRPVIPTAWIGSPGQVANPVGSGTLDKINLWRLYQKGWCPIVYDGGGLRYDTTQVYYIKDHVVDKGAQQCQ